MRRSDWKRCVVTAAVALAAAVPLARGTELFAAKPRVWVVTALKSPDSWSVVYPNSINRRGTINGFREESTPAFEAHAVIWQDRDADPVDLPEITEAVAGFEQRSWSGNSNDRGQIAGQSHGHAVIWDRTGAITDLHLTLTGFRNSTAWSLTKRGHAAGQAVSAANGATRAILWPSGATTVEPLPMDESAYLQTRAYAMNERGDVVGIAGQLPTGGPFHAACWPGSAEPRVMIDLHAKVQEAMPTALASAALAALENGQIAGCAWIPAAAITDQQAWIYDPRSDSVSLLADDEAKLAAAWSWYGNKLLFGYLDSDWLRNGGRGAIRPALWERKKVRGETVWNLTVLPIPEGFVGMVPVMANSKGALIASASMADGKIRGFLVTKGPPQ